MGEIANLPLLVIMYWNEAIIGFFMQPPRRAPRPNYVSTASYWREGRRQMEVALDRFPTLQAIDALIWYLHDGTELAPATVLRYRENCRRAVYVWARKIKADAAWIAMKMTDIDAALASRRKQGRRKRGTKKIPRLASEIEFRKVTSNLQQRYHRTKDITPALTFFYAYAMKITGARPIELVGASVVGTAIKIPNAKRKAGQAEFRFLSLAEFSPSVLTAFEIFLDIIGSDSLSNFEFQKFRNRLSESLARACAREQVARLSLYSFRHLAIALWTESGVLAEVIAQMAGHFSTRTAARQYAKTTKGGWKPVKRQSAKLAGKSELSKLISHFIEKDMKPGGALENKPAVPLQHNLGLPGEAYPTEEALRKEDAEPPSALPNIETAHSQPIVKNERSLDGGQLAPAGAPETDGQRLWREWKENNVPKIPTFLGGPPRKIPTPNQELNHSSQEPDWSNAVSPKTGERRK